MSNVHTYIYTQSHKVEVKKKSRKERQLRKRPDKVLYMPPSLRKTHPQAEETSLRETPPQAEETSLRETPPQAEEPSGVYRLKVEISPGQWHEQNVERVGAVHKAPL